MVKEKGLAFEIMEPENRVAIVLTAVSIACGIACWFMLGTILAGISFITGIIAAILAYKRPCRVFAIIGTALGTIGLTVAVLGILKLIGGLA